MNSAMIEIHEFSTGIRPERTHDGSWVSRGFTGQYMNMTLPSIPLVVENSIANREFALTEGTSRNSPGVIGRVVGSGEEVWSVVAVVTRGKDEKGRSLSVYRYFLCLGETSLRLIIGWWENQGMPRFDPFDVTTVGRPHLFDADSLQPPNLHQEAMNLAVDRPEPILLSPEQEYDLQTINTLAFKKFNTQNKIQPVSWAFNVEALEQPRRFQVIYAASPRGYEILDRAIKNTPKLLGPVIGDEEAIKSAIRGLMNSSQVRREALQTITGALQNRQISKEYWHSWFNGQGAETAISQKIYSPQMVRLITLRAMVIPETLPNFLDWLNIKGGKKTNEHQTVSVEFQSAIRDLDLFPKEKLADGIKFILPQLLEKKITPESVNWLMSEDSAWFACRQEFITHILSDLQSIADYLKSPQFNTPQAKFNLSQHNFKCGSDIWQDLIKYDISQYALSAYKPLAELFKYMNKYRLSAYFYEVSDGVVPKKIFKKVADPDGLKGNVIKYLGLDLHCQVTRSEKIWFFIQNNIDHLAIITGLILLTILCLMLFKNPELLLLSNKQKKPIDKPIPLIPFSCKNITKKFIQKIPDNNKNQFEKTTLDIAIDNFKITKIAITQLVNQLTEELAQEKINREKIPQKWKKEIEEQFNQNIEGALKCVLVQFVNPENRVLDYTGTFKDNKSYNQEAWIDAIYNYQKSKNTNNAFGFMNAPNDQGQFQTYKDLKQDIKYLLNQQNKKSN